MLLREVNRFVGIILLFSVNPPYCIICFLAGWLELVVGS